MRERCHVTHNTIGCTAADHADERLWYASLSQRTPQMFTFRYRGNGISDDSIRLCTLTKMTLCDGICRAVATGSSGDECEE